MGLPTILFPKPEIRSESKTYTPKITCSSSLKLTIYSKQENKNGEWHTPSVSPIHYTVPSRLFLHIYSPRSSSISNSSVCWIYHISTNSSAITESSVCYVPIDDASL